MRVCIIFALACLPLLACPVGMTEDAAHNADAKSSNDVTSADSPPSDNNALPDAQELTDSNMFQDVQVLTDSNVLQDAQVLTDSNVFQDSHVSIDAGIADIDAVDATINDATHIDHEGQRPPELIRAALQQAMLAVESDVDFTLLLVNTDGVFFESSTGSSSADTLYESASTSKWVAASVIVDQTRHSALSLDSHPQDFIDFWTSDVADARSHITVRQLLSFTSGLQDANDEPMCLNLPNGDMETCVQNMYDTAASSTHVPGQEFIYGSTHLQLAGLMAIRAAEQATNGEVSTWSQLFDAFRTTQGLFAQSRFNLPSLSNPRLAGGMTWTAREYADFLGKLYQGQLLHDEDGVQMLSDHTVDGIVAMTSSPVFARLREQWHYGLGCWRECHHLRWQSECDPISVVSSPGAYGAYPFIDFANGYWGILARQGALGTFADGYLIFDELRPLIEELATRVAN